MCGGYITKLIRLERYIRKRAVFNLYMTEQAAILERPAAPGLSLHDSEIKLLL